MWVECEDEIVLSVVDLKSNVGWKKQQEVVCVLNSPIFYGCEFSIDQRMLVTWRRLCAVLQEGNGDED